MNTQQKEYNDTTKNEEIGCQEKNEMTGKMTPFVFL